MIVRCEPPVKGELKWFFRPFGEGIADHPLPSAIAATNQFWHVELQVPSETGRQIGWKRTCAVSSDGQQRFTRRVSDPDATVVSQPSDRAPDRCGDFG